MRLCQAGQGGDLHFPALGLFRRKFGEFKELKIGEQIVAKVDEDFTRLGIGLDPSGWILRQFKPTRDNRAVVGTRREPDGGFEFTDACGIRYMWQGRAQGRIRAADCADVCDETGSRRGDRRIGVASKADCKGLKKAGAGPVETGRWSGRRDRMQSIELGRVVESGSLCLAVDFVTWSADRSRSRGRWRRRWWGILSRGSESLWRGRWWRRRRRRGNQCKGTDKRPIGPQGETAAAVVMAAA